MKLTDVEIRKAKPKEKRFELSDGDGLALRVMPTGTKSWIYRYQFGGKARRMTLGSYPGVTLSIARERHKSAKKDLQRGEDPSIKRESAPTFESALNEFFEIELSKTVSGAERLRLISKDALSEWGKRKIADLTRRDAVLLLDHVRNRAPVTANRLQATLVRMFNFCAERGLIEVNPLLGLRKAPEKSRSRILSLREIKAVWNSLDIGNRDFRLFISGRLILKMIILTGQRPGEVTGMSWGEIDMENRVWNVPAERVKIREPHSVPLNPMAIDVLDEARMYASDSDFVFPSDRGIKQHINRHAVTFATRKHWKVMGADSHFTPHDLRRTVRSMLAELGVDDVVAEKVVGHKLGGMLGVYNRHGYDAEKREALSRWEQRLSEILGHTEAHGGQVISFAARKGGA